LSCLADQKDERCFSLGAGTGMRMKLPVSEYARVMLFPVNGSGTESSKVLELLCVVRLIIVVAEHFFLSTLSQKFYCSESP
jgi:hypothetical protein